MHRSFFKYYLNSFGTRLAFVYVVVLLLIAILATVLANPQNGLITKYGPNSIGTENNIFREPGFIDQLNGTVRIHPLGTEGRGRDIAAIMIHGTRTSLLLGFLASLLAIFLGTTLGIVSAYYGNRTLKVHPLSIALFLILSPFLIYYCIEWSWIIADRKIVFDNWKFATFSIGGIALVIFTVDKLKIIWTQRTSLPIDNIVMRFTEIFKAVPTLFLLLSIISFLRSQSLWSTTLLIGILGWPRILRLVRGEVLDIKKEIFITNAKLLGLSDLKIVMRHIIPNILPLILVSMAFLISTNILLESTLSFLGLGLPLDQASWGGLLRQSREDFGAWWLAVFPGLAITFTLFSLNILAERYNNMVKKGLF